MIFRRRRPESRASELPGIPDPPGSRSFAAPLWVGLIFGLARHLPEDPSLGFIYWQSPFLFSVLGGVAIAFTCRPVLSRIPWSRTTAFVLGVVLLTILGPAADWCAGALMGLLGLGRIPMNLPANGWSLLSSALAGGLAMGFFFGAGTGNVGMSSLRARLVDAGMGAVGRKVALLGLIAVALLLLAGWGDARWEEASELVYLPLLEPNPWLRLEGLWLRENGAGSVALSVGVLWLRWLVVALALLPIALTLRGSWLQLTLVFGVLLFVVGDFAPLMAQQPYPSIIWLLERVALGLAKAMALGGAYAALLGLRPQNG